MPHVVVICGHPRAGSRTFALASAIGEIVAARRGVAPVVTAGFQPQADVSEALLARLLSELGADVVDCGLTATESELTDIAGLAGQYARALGI